MAPTKSVDWSAVASYQRLLAAVVATGVKIDYNETAKYFGTTYSSIEKRFRVIKSDAQELKAANGNASLVPTPTKPRNSHGKKSAEEMLIGVASGRVVKSGPTKRSQAKLKSRRDSCEPDEDRKEMLEDDEEV